MIKPITPKEILEIKFYTDEDLEKAITEMNGILIKSAELFQKGLQQNINTDLFKPKQLMDKVIDIFTDEGWEFILNNDQREGDYYKINIYRVI